MLDPHAVAQMHAVRVARPPTVEERRALAHERSKHAVLHVKHRHVLVQRDFKRGTRSAERRIGVRPAFVQKREHLLDVQIVADRHAFESAREEILGRERIRDIQREVADAPQRCRLEIINRTEIADQHAIGRSGFDQLEEPLLARLLDARRREENRGTGFRPVLGASVGTRFGISKNRLTAFARDRLEACPASAHERDGILVSSDILEIHVERRDSAAECCLDLFHRAAEHGERGGGLVIGDW